MTYPEIVEDTNLMLAITYLVAKFKGVSPLKANQMLVQTLSTDFAMCPIVEMQDDESLISQAIDKLR